MPMSFPLEEQPANLDITVYWLAYCRIKNLAVHIIRLLARKNILRNEVISVIYISTA